MRMSKHALNQRLETASPMRMPMVRCMPLRRAPQVIKKEALDMPLNEEILLSLDRNGDGVDRAECVPSPCLA